ncbi:unnamed protein product [Scytosiphon promiscuus]
MSSRRPRKNGGLPVFRTGMNSSGQMSLKNGGMDGSGTSHCERSKRLHRKPPVPVAAAAAAAAAATTPLAQVTPRDESGSRTARRDARGKGSSPRRYVERLRSPNRRDKPVEQRERRRESPPHDGGGGDGDAGRGEGRGLERKHMLRMLRQAVEEMDVRHRDLVSAHRESAVWKQRGEELSRTVLRLEGRCEALVESVRSESDSALAEARRAKAAELRFARLLAWARVEEKRKSQAEEMLQRAREAGSAAEARGKILEEEARESKRQLDERRLKLEAALEDLRCRTSDKERLEAHTATVEGQVEALRELADARGVEIKELREKLERLVKEAKCMSSENVKIRKSISSEQERWRAAERSRGKHDDRRRMEMEQKNDDLHTLRYRIQELEARLLSETARRQGAEEDARLSQEMERRSMEELLASRNGTTTARSGVEQANSYPPHHLHPAPTPASAGSAWIPWNNGMVWHAATTVGKASGARSSKMPDAPLSDEHIRRNGQRHPCRHPADSWGWREPTARTTRVDAVRKDPRPSPPFTPSSRRAPPPSLPLNHPALSASSLLASLRGRGAERYPSPASAGLTARGAVPSYPQLRPTACSTAREEEEIRQDVRPRPEPRQAPSDDDGGRHGDDGNSAVCDAFWTRRGGDDLRPMDTDGRSEDRREWWAGSASWEGVDSQPSTEDGGASLNRKDQPLRVVSL